MKLLAEWNSHQCCFLFPVKLCNKQSAAHRKKENNSNQARMFLKACLIKKKLVEKNVYYCKISRLFILSLLDQYAIFITLHYSVSFIAYL